MMSRSNIARLLRYRPATAIRALLLVTAVAGSLVAAYVVFGVSGWVAATPATVQAAALPGTASLSGTVTRRNLSGAVEAPSYSHAAYSNCRLRPS